MGSGRGSRGAGEGGFLFLPAILSALAGAAAGVCTYRAFRKRRKRAESAGEHGPFGVYEAFFKRPLDAVLAELPELWNILRGDMSLVGPRPLLAEYLGRYDGRQARRHEVRPGLTGLAQVNGRNAVSWEEKFEEDITYVDHITFAGDVRILLQTALVVMKREGISSASSATMEAFTGSRPGGVKE